MGVFSSFDISSSGLNAEKLRMDVISRNIANAKTTRTASGTPYRRQIVVMREVGGNSFSDYLSSASNKYSVGRGVEVSAVVDDMTPLKTVYDPSHPDADSNGYVSMPNVDTITEMVNMISASRAYEANLMSLNNAKSMALKALDIGLK